MTDWRSLLKAQAAEVSVDEKQLAQDIDRILRKQFPVSANNANSNSSFNTLSNNNLQRTASNVTNRNETGLDEPSITATGGGEDYVDTSARTISSRSNSNANNNNNNNNNNSNSGKNLHRNSVGSVHTAASTNSGSNKLTRSASSPRARTSFSSTTTPTTAAATLPANTPPSLVLADAPDASRRYEKARQLQLQQQLQEANEGRKQQQQQLRESERQLQIMTEENKILKKRIQLLESDNKRQLNRKSNSNGNLTGGNADAANQADASVQIETLNQTVAALQRDLQTAERIIKQHNTNANLAANTNKRLTEQVNRLRAQLTQQQLTNNSNSGDANEHQQQVQQLEERLRQSRQRCESVVQAYHKQQQLVHVLKQQRLHMEALALVGLTEDEFVRTLDWNL